MIVMVILDGQITFTLQEMHHNRPSSFEHQILLQPNISGLKRIFITSSIFTRIIPTFGIGIPTRMRQKQGLNFYN